MGQKMLYTYSKYTTLPETLFLLFHPKQTLELERKQPQLKISWLQSLLWLYDGYVLLQVTPDGPQFRVVSLRAKETSKIGVSGAIRRRLMYPIAQALGMVLIVVSIKTTKSSRQDIPRQRFYYSRGMSGNFRSNRRTSLMR